MPFAGCRIIRLSRDEQIRQEFLDDLRRERRVLIEASRGIELASAFRADPVVADKLLVQIGALVGRRRTSPIVPPVSDGRGLDRRLRFVDVS